jgi:hypothetical protein
MVELLKPTTKRVKEVRDSIIKADFELTKVWDGQANMQS